MSSSSIKVQHLRELSAEARQRLVESFDTVLFDCDGVLWRVFEPIDGVAEALQLLQQRGKQLRFITNNSVRSFESYREAFRDLGLEITEEDIIHPSTAIVRYLRTINFDGLIYCIGSGTFKRALKDAGFALLDGPSDPLEESFRQIIGTVHDRAPVRAVIVDVDFNANYPKLIRAELYLKGHPDCLLIAGATDRALHVKQNFNLMGPGVFTAALEAATGKHAIVLGKPGEALGAQVVQQYGLWQPERTLFVGDKPEQDMAFAKVCGFQGLLVLSGGTTKEEFDATTDTGANYYADSVADLAELLRQLP